MNRASNTLFFIFLFFLSCTTFFTVPMDSCENYKIKQLRGVAFTSDNRLIVASGDGCLIGKFDAERKLLSDIKKITQKSVCTIASDSKKNFLGLLPYNEGPIIYDTRTGSTIMKMDDIINTMCFSPHNTFFSFGWGTLYKYNMIQKKSKKDFVNWGARMYFSSISHHSIQDNVIYISAERELTIVHFDENSIHQENIPIDDSAQALEYSPYGNFLALRMTHLGDYFICDLDCTKNTIKTTPLKRPQLNRSYIAHVFHPYASIIALLTYKGNVHYFDYVTGGCIAATKKLGESDLSDLSSTKKYVDISLDGKTLVAVFSESNNYAFIDVPQNNFFDCYKYLLKTDISTEIVKNIFTLFIQCHKKSHKENFSFFNLKALLNVQHMKQKPLTVSDYLPNKSQANKILFDVYKILLGMELPKELAQSIISLMNVSYKRRIVTQPPVMQLLKATKSGMAESFLTDVQSHGRFMDTAAVVKNIDQINPCERFEWFSFPRLNSRDRRN